MGREGAHSDVSAILMASGFSRRFGEQDKLLATFRGKALARYTLELVTRMDFGQIFFIVASDYVAALAEDLSAVRVVKNAAPEKGRRESVRLGLEAAGSDPAYYLFFPCDQPFLDVPSVQRILDARQPGCIVEPRYQGRPGNLTCRGSPSLFSAAFREELLSLKEGEAPGSIKTRRPEALIGVELDNSLVLKDIDDEETLKNA